jgi:hypothetical protein
VRSDRKGPLDQTECRRSRWRPLYFPAATGIELLSAWAIRAEFPRIASDNGLWNFGAFVASGRAAATG